MRLRALWGLLVAITGLAACATSPPAGESAPPATPGVATAPSAAPPAEPPVESAEEAARRALLAKLQPKLDEALARVALARGVASPKPVKLAVVDRPTILKYLQSKVDREMPAHVLRAQGDFLTALELVPADYDFTTRTLELVKDALAGYYEPDDATMYLAADLPESAVEPTLLHELGHALQDQLFDLKGKLSYRPGESDRVAAYQTLAEGDANEAMFAAMGTVAPNPGLLRKAMLAELWVGQLGKGTPSVLLESLVTPYVDGGALVGGLRDRGGWSAVDAVWRAPPDTTEQLLHADKLKRREPAKAVAPLPLGPYADWKVALDDVMGEQALRVVVTDWSSAAEAAVTAAGWGGDRWVVLEKVDASERQVAFAWKIAFDTQADAADLASKLTKKWGAGCRERPTLGPLAHLRRGAEVVLVAGPFVRTATGAKAATPTGCAEASKWAQTVAATAK
jgi:hypothetical protein